MSVVQFCIVVLLGVPYSQAQRVIACNTPNGEIAACISIYSCPVLYSVVTTTNTLQIQFLKDSQCGYGHEPLVCCGTQNFYQDRATNAPNTRHTTRRKTTNRRNPSLLPDRSQCGFHDAERILDGEETGLTEFPWMVLLQYKRKSSRETTFSCGGTLISQRYVVTAAHCVKGGISKSLVLHRVRLGEWSTQTDIDCVTVRGYEDCNDPPVDVGVEKIIPHPEYDDNSPSKYNDIALLRLNQNVRFTDFIKPICLQASKFDRSQVGEKVIVAGWGRTEHGTSSPVKLKLQIPVTSDAQCFSRFQTASVAIADTQLCAGGELGSDSCSGDSGGPLMNTFKNDSGQWFLEGVVSFGARCGTQGWPGVYTRVASYLDWIENTIRE